MALYPLLNVSSYQSSLKEDLILWVLFPSSSTVKCNAAELTLRLWESPEVHRDQFRRVSWMSSRKCSYIILTPWGELLWSPCVRRPSCVVRRAQFASNEISSVSTRRISTKVDRIISLAVLYQNCRSRSSPLHKKNHSLNKKKKKKKKKKPP